MKTGYFRFEKLEVWNDAKEFISLVYKITAKFPSNEQFGLTNQIRRASISIALNTAEGSIKGSDADFRRFLKMAQGSLHETVTGFYIALDQNLISRAQFEEIYEYSLKVDAKFYAFLKALSVKHSALSN